MADPVYPSPTYGTVTTKNGVVLPDGSTVKGVGTGTGAVASGPALAAETTRATTAEGTNATAIQGVIGSIAAEGARAQSAEQANATGVSANATAIGNETTRAVAAEATAALKSNNLSDLANAATARANLGLGTAATAALGQPNGAASLDSTGKALPSQLPIGTAGGVVGVGQPVDTNTVTATGGTVARTNATRSADTTKIVDLGARCDGQSHPLSGSFATLAVAQAVYPSAAALTDEIDWAATQTAVSRRAAAGGGVIELPQGTCTFNRSVTGPNSGYPNLRVIGQGPGTIINPNASMTALFTVLTGFFDIQDVSFTNVNSYAAEAIEENKAFNNLPNRFIRNRYIGFTKAVRVISGDVFAVDDSFFLNNTTAISLESYCVNGRVRGNYTLGGNGLDMPGSSTQQCEGVSIEHNEFLVGVANAFGVRILGGLQIDLTDNTIDQITAGPGVIVDASTYPVNAVTIKGGFIGAQGGATNATNGLQVGNGANNITIEGVTLTGWYGYDVYASTVSHLGLSDLRALSTAGVANASLVNAAATTISGGFFANPTGSVLESGTTVTRETNAHFVKTPTPVAASQYINDYGNTKTPFTVANGGADHVQIVSGAGTATIQTQGTSSDRYLVLSSGGVAPVILAPNGQTKFVAGVNQNLSAVPFGVPKLAAAPSTAPGAGYLTLYALSGTNSGTCKLQALAGTSTTPVTIADNVGSGC